MALPVVLRPRALGDLDAIWDYTVQAWSEQQAVVYLTGLDAAFNLIAEHPEIARLRHELNPPVRVYAYREHVIIYIGQETEIDILRVVHGRSHWVSYLNE